MKLLGWLRRKRTFGEPALGAVRPMMSVEVSGFAGQSAVALAMNAERASLAAAAPTGLSHNESLELVRAMWGHYASTMPGLKSPADVVTQYLSQQVGIGYCRVPITAGWLEGMVNG